MTEPSERFPQARPSWCAQRGSWTVTTVPSAALAALVMTSVLACAKAPMPVPVPAAPTPSTVEVRVDNRHSADVKVYARHGDQRFELGTVPSHSTMRMEVPDRIPLFDLRLLVERQQGGASFETKDLDVIPGDVVDLIVGASLSETRADIA